MVSPHTPPPPLNREQATPFLRLQEVKQDSGWTPDTMFLFYIYTKLKLLTKERSPEHMIRWVRSALHMMQFNMECQISVFHCTKTFMYLTGKKTRMVLCIFTYHL